MNEERTKNDESMLEDGYCILGIKKLEEVNSK